MGHQQRKFLPSPALKAAVQQARSERTRQQPQQEADESPPRLMTSWAELLEEVSVPAEIGVALATGRPELLMLAKRDMSKEEVGMLLNVLRVLMETNQHLRAHSQQVAIQVTQLRGHFIGLEGAIEKLRHFANFREPGSVEEEEGN